MDEPRSGDAVIEPPIRFRLEDMVEYARLALKFQGDFGPDELAADDRTRLALIRAVQIVGEAATKIPSDFRDAQPTIPWRRAINMRNILVHAYRQIDLDILTKTVREDFPVLIADIGALLGEQDT